MRIRYGAGCLALCLSMALGCNGLQLNPIGGDKRDKAEKQAKEQLPAPGKYELRVSQFLFLSDFELKKNLPIFQDLSALREQVYKELKLPSAQAPVLVYVFENREHYDRYMHSRYPDLPRRRAFFVAQPHAVGGGEDLIVYTYWGDRIREDLRHELTHALLHGVLKDVPLWLDEGLAEYFELPIDSKGVNYQHLEQLRRGSFEPNMGRLEQLSQVQQMTPAEYRESWAWAHLMLRGNAESREVLIRYLQQLRTNPNPGPLQPRLAEVVPALDEVLERHLASLDVVPRAATPATVQR